MQEGLRVIGRKDLHAESVAARRREGHWVNWKLPGGAGVRALLLRRELLHG